MQAGCSKMRYGATRMKPQRCAKQVSAVRRSLLRSVVIRKPYDMRTEKKFHVGHASGRPHVVAGSAQEQRYEVWGARTYGRPSRNVREGVTVRERVRYRRRQHRVQRALLRVYPVYVPTVNGSERTSTVFEAVAQNRRPIAATGGVPICSGSTSFGKEAAGSSRQCSTRRRLIQMAGGAS